MTLIDIPSTSDGFIAWVNPKNVIAVVAYPDGGSFVRFVDGNGVETDLNAIEVVRRLESAEAGS